MSRQHSGDYVCKYYRELKRAYEVLNQHTVFIPMPLSPEEQASKDHERKRKNWRDKIALRNHHYRFTFEE